MQPSFWQGKRVFLTGHTGFKGSWLSLWLQILGVDVMGYSLAPPTQPNLFELAEIGRGMNSIEGDVRNLEQLQKAIAQFKPQIVFHLAAQSLVRQSYQSPVETYATNVMGTVHLLEAVRQLGQGCIVINVTSDKCYENREWIWGYRENDPLGGYDPYSNSKGCAELVTSAYRNSFFPAHNYTQHGVALASARAGNVIGGGDWASDRLIPDVLRSLIAKQTPLIRNPHAIRPWQHVLEPLNGYLTLAEHLDQQGTAFSEAWNFGPNNADIQPVSWVVDQLFNLWGEGTWERDKMVQPHEAYSLKLDSSKARTKLGWQPKMNLTTALTWVVDWTRALQEGVNLHGITQSQIHRFMELVDA